MAAVVRVKRRHDEPVADSIVLLSKRQKLSEYCEDGGENVKTVFKYAGTQHGNDRTVSNCVKQAISKEKLEKEYKRLNVNSYREERVNKTRTIGLDARYNIVAAKRGPSLAALNETAEPEKSSDEAGATSCSTDDKDRKEKDFRLLDIETDKSKSLAAGAKDMEEISCNGKPMFRIKLTVLPTPTKSEPESEKFVYDLYYMNNAKSDFRALEHVLAVEAYKEEFDYNSDGSDLEDFYDDEDDENDESNWRNDYPDEDPHLVDPLPKSSDKYFNYYDETFEAGFSRLRGTDDDTDDATDQLENLESHINNHLNLGNTGEESPSDNPRYYADMFKKLRDE